MTEVGRQPWIVFGLQRTEDAVSPNVSVAMVAFSLIVFALTYGALMWRMSTYWQSSAGRSG